MPRSGSAWGRRRAEAAARATVRRAIRPVGDGRSERWHRTGQSGTLRAVIFGVSDGLVSNLSLVMGVAGATAVEPRFILLAGIAGLLAGSFSMAAGEYISMQSQRELYERQIALERAELEAMPGEEEAELAADLPVQGLLGGRGGHASPIASSRTPRRPSTPSSARSWASIPVSSARPGARAAGSFAAFADRRLRPGHPVPLRRRRRRSSRSASWRASSGCSPSGPG